MTDLGIGEQDGMTRLMKAVSGLIWTAVFAVLALVLGALLDWLLASLAPEATFPRNALSMTAGALLASFVLPRPSDISQFAGFGLAWTRSSVTSGTVGLALGVLIAAVSVGLPWGTGALEFERQSPAEGAWLLGDVPFFPFAALVLITAAVGEELLVRGYAFQQLARAITPAGSAVATGILFGALHAPNPSADWISVVNTGLFGVLFGFATVRWRSLWPAIGMHLGWNLSLAILGANISGLRMGLTALRATPVGATAWTGGEYGPEASLVATITVLAAIVVVWKAPVPADGSPLIWDDIRSSEGGTEDSCEDLH